MSRVWKLLCETRHSIVDALRTRDNESHAQLFSSLKNISEEIVAIEDFCRTHRLVFGELLKYYEPRMPNALRELLSRKCKDSSFGRVKLSNFLIPMSECYSNLRKLEAGEGVSRPNSVGTLFSNFYPQYSIYALAWLHKMIPNLFSISWFSVQLRVAKTQKSMIPFDL